MDISENIKCIIFDLDGTLANFNIDYESMRNELKSFFKKYGETSEFSPLIQEIQKISTKLNNPQIIKEAYEIIDKYELESLNDVKIIEKIAELYKKYSSNKKIIILTRNGNKLVEAFLDKYHLPYPEFISSRDNCQNLKPDIEQFDIFYKKLFLDKKGYLLIGDSYHDEELAKRTRINFKNVSEI